MNNTNTTINIPTINTSNGTTSAINSKWPSFTNNMTEDDIALRFDFDDEDVQFSYKELKYLKKMLNEWLYDNHPEELL